MDRIILHTDGGARGNPGPAGAGAVAFDEAGRIIIEASRYLGRQTNNFAEYHAVILGLETLLAHYGAAVCRTLRVVVRMDSELVCKQLNREYRVKEPTLIPLHARVRELVDATFPHLSFEHVRRAANADADRLANDAMDRGK